jgi:hypothetical protein
MLLQAWLGFLLQPNCLWTAFRSNVQLIQAWCRFISDSLRGLLREGSFDPEFVGCQGTVAKLSSTR